jgi:hypothetical protein
MIVPTCEENKAFKSEKHNKMLIAYLRSFFESCPTMFKTIIDLSDRISISGSSILSLFDSSTVYTKTDIDVYVNISNEKNSAELFMHIFLINNILHDYLSKHDYQCMNKVDLVDVDIMYNPDTLDPESNYFSLRKYIHKIIEYKNKTIRKKIQFIFIKTDIKSLISKTFDFDIVKNFYCQNSYYISNLNSINQKVANISLLHFKNRICTNRYEFNNFISRFYKYKIRGFKIFIGSMQINYPIISMLNRIHPKIAFNVFIIMRFLKKRVLISRIEKYVIHLNDEYLAPDSYSMIYRFKYCNPFDRQKTIKKNKHTNLLYKDRILKIK